ncbi:MAG: NAD(P)/FAD-dependent oxidoreductase [Elusimicrobiales bacterium]|nr:NAD(P)/FAD-dependent oxidoreductase [Elusimicrobiales bacterium]
MDGKTKTIIIGAGPAGLTAACELASSGRADVTVYEADSCAGGISRTVKYKNRRIDIGGHRFFSKSDRVTEWWKRLLPVQGAPARDDIALNRILFSPDPSGPDPERADDVLLVRRRVSRILHGGKFYDYPVTLSARTLANLGALRAFRIGCAYLRRRLFPLKPERSLEDFYINRFGGELYRAFFRSYTEKVWGVPCSQIKPDWGAQRVKGLSVAGALSHAVKKLLGISRPPREVETSLIERFLYPKFGPGQLWEKAANVAAEKGANIFYRHKVVGLKLENGAIKSALVKNLETGCVFEREADNFISTMPVKDLVEAMNGGAVPPEVRKTAQALSYRDFVTAGLFYRKIKAADDTGAAGPGLVPDTWIYIQEPQVKMGRLQIFNNWSPYLAGEPEGVWLGLEFFCSEGDDFWNLPDDEIAKIAARELAAIGFADESELRDSTVARSLKTYPGYFGAYADFPVVRGFIDTVKNLYPVGRNGMHRYNNMDHSMLTAMKAAEIILGSGESKTAIWNINSEEDYHESRQS